MDPEITGAVLEKWRIQRDLQQKELAEESGLTYGVVGTLLRGERLPESDEFVRMCHGMNADLVEVFTECCNAYVGKLLESEAKLLTQKGIAVKPAAERFFTAEMEQGLESMVAGARKFLPLFSLLVRSLERSDQFIWLKPPQAAEPAPASSKRRRARSSSKRSAKRS